jgi:hypothetical protein
MRIESEREATTCVDHAGKACMDVREKSYPAWPASLAIRIRPCPTLKISEILSLVSIMPFRFRDLTLQRQESEHSGRRFFSSVLRGMTIVSQLSSF